MKIRFGGVSAGIAVVAAIAAFAAPGMHGQLWAKTAGTGQSNAWQAVIAADKAEISALNAVTAAAMKKGDPNAVVAAHGLLVTVRARLAHEKTLQPFPPFFQAATDTVGLPQPEEKLELARDKAVSSAIISSDEKKIADINAGIAAAMKASKASLVVSDMSLLKRAKLQLARDKSAAAMLVPQPAPAGAFNQPGSFFHPGGFPAGAQIPANQGQFQNSGTAVGTAIPEGRWRGLVAAAMKPVGEFAVPQISTELVRFRANPGKLLGMRVLAFLKAGSAGGLTISGEPSRASGLTRGARVQRLQLRKEITRHFHAIRSEARARQAAEYRWQLDRQKSLYPRAVMWQVPPATVRQEQIERSRVSRPSREEQTKYLRLVAQAFLPQPDTASLVAPPGTHVPSSGAVYGIVVGISSSSVNRQTPAISLPSGTAFRQVHNPYFVQGAIQTDPPEPPNGGLFFGTVPAENIPSVPVAPCKVYSVTILYCGRSPHYRFPVHTRALGPIKGYVFHLKNGNTVQATSYTTGTDYYHTVWDGIGIPVAKNLVVKISVIRK